jgi:hypothetical protein
VTQRRAEGSILAPAGRGTTVTYKNGATALPRLVAGVLLHALGPERRRRPCGLGTLGRRRDCHPNCHPTS